VPVDDELGDENPSNEDGCQSRELDQSWERGKRNFLHMEHPMSDDRVVPVEARLKSSGLSIGDLALLAGVRPSAIRYYEACGLLRAPPKRSGRRVHDHGAVVRLRAILSARSLGFSIDDIRRLAAAGPQTWRQEAHAKSHSLKALIAKLSANAAQLDDLSNCDCKSETACRL
jgi:DNA-binding transcriptional MerR regulator